MIHQWILLIMTTPFDLYGEYRHRTVATYSTVQEEEYFDAVEYTAYDDLVDDLIDVLNPEMCYCNV